MLQPQIVGFSPGRANLGLDASDVFTRKGHWKKQRVVVILPTAEQLPAKAALAMWNLAFPPNNGVAKLLAQGMEVGEAYSQTIEWVIKHPELSDWEYVLTVEHDNIPPPDGVIQLIQDMEDHPEFSCIGGLYWTKGYQDGGFDHFGVPQIWGDPADPILNFRPQIPKPEQIQECCGTGMGFNLWRMSMFKDERLPRPLFQTKAGKEGCGTQDLAFWTEARKHGYRCAIDTRVKVGHYDWKTDITW